MLNTTAWLLASSTSTRRKYIAVGVRFVTCSSYDRNAPESLIATVGGFGTLNSIDGGICVCAAASAGATAPATTNTNTDVSPTRFTECRRDRHALPRSDRRSCD